MEKTKERHCGREGKRRSLTDRNPQIHETEVWIPLNCVVTSDLLFLERISVNVFRVAEDIGVGEREKRVETTGEKRIICFWKTGGGRRNGIWRWNIVLG